jgi:phosphoglycolate phosphatase
MTSIETIVFDLDGTLVDSYDALTSAINVTRASLRLEPIDLETLKTMVGEGIERLLDKALGKENVSPESRALFEKSYDEVCCIQSRLLEDVDITLEQLSAHNVGMAVCTNKPTSFSVKILEHLGISRFFAAVVGPDVAGARKPDAKHILFTIEAAKGEPSSSLMVGDMPIDVLAARSAGIPVAVVPTGSSSMEALRLSEPDFFLASFSDLVPIVQSRSKER